MSFGHALPHLTEPGVRRPVVERASADSIESHLTIVFAPLAFSCEARARNIFVRKVRPAIAPVCQHAPGDPDQTSGATAPKAVSFGGSSMEMPSAASWPVSA